MGLVAAIIILLTLSIHRHGFVAISSPTTKFGGYIWRKGLLWTTLPSLIIQFYSTWFGLVVGAASERQPYVELARPSGSSARRTIFLDYRANSQFGSRQYHALRNGHYLLAGAWLLAVLLSLIISPLSARMIFENDYTGNKPVDTGINQAFPLNSPGLPYLTWDFEPVLDIVSATQIYQAPSIPWVTSEFAFPEVTQPSIPSNADGLANLTISSAAYSAYLECNVLSPSDYHQVNDTNSGNINFSGSDRGCNWQYSLLTPKTSVYYLAALSTSVSCPSYRSSPATGRYLILGADVEQHAVKNISVVSCIPTYWTRNGSLTLSYSPITLPSVSAFDVNGPTISEYRPWWWASFESNIQQVAAVDTTTNFNVTTTTNFGRMILDYSRRHSSPSYLGSDAISNAAQTLFTSLYATMLSTQMFTTAPIPVPVSGVLSTTSSRLFVAIPIAAIMIAALIFAALVIILIWIYTVKHGSVLFEEPVGLAGAASVMCGSVVNTKFGEIRDGRGFSGCAAEDLKRSQWAEAPSRFVMSEQEDPIRAKIVRYGREDDGLY